MAAANIFGPAVLGLSDAAFFALLSHDSVVLCHTRVWSLSSTSCWPGAGLPVATLLPTIKTGASLLAYVFVEALQGFTSNASQALHVAYTVQQGMSAAACRMVSWDSAWLGQVY